MKESQRLSMFALYLSKCFIHQLLYAVQKLWQLTCSFQCTQSDNVMFKLLGTLWPYATGNEGHLLSWQKMLGRFPKLNMKFLHAPMQCCHVAVCVYVQSECHFSGCQRCLGEGGFQTFAMTAAPCLRRLVIDVQNTNVHCKRYFRTYPRKYWPGW